jgi:activator of 2-hydroxyglutaryl-CoA dehydratase
VFCGWDWGSTHHGVCVIDDGGTVLRRWLIAHNGERLAAGVVADRY